MQNASKRFLRGGAASLICVILLTSNVLGDEIGQRDPSFGQRLRTWFHRVVKTFGDNIIIPPG